MATNGKYISELDEVTSLSGNEELIFQDGDTTGKVRSRYLKGEKGVTGKDGKDLTFEDLTNDQIAQLKGAKGPKGDAGAKGATGIPGPKGPVGPDGATGEAGVNGSNGRNGAAGVNGKSVFQQAQEAGFTGTESQLGDLLLSLPQMSADVENLYETFNTDYFVAAYDEEQLDPTPKFTKGNKDFLADWDFVLLDTTDNTEVTTHPVGILQRNNLLRFQDGSFAPTVGITESQRAECDVDLYRKSADGQLSLYCTAGAFDAELFYNANGMEKLYNSNGNEVRVLRPWETTETKYTIGLAYLKGPLYLLDQVKGKSDIVWKGIFTSPTVWDGIDVTPWKLDVTAIGPCPCCTIGGAMRNFFYLYEGETNCKSSNGAGNVVTMFNNNRTYPRVSDVSQITNMDYARKNNADSTKPYPFAEGGYHALNTFITCMELLHETKYLHDPNLFGSGISSNDNCNNESTFLSNGGVRYKKESDTDWTYCKYSTNAFPYVSSGTKTNISNLLNQEYPKEQCMESQMATSFAVETNVAENADFEFYGAIYRYKNVTQAGGIANGLNVQLFKIMSQTVNAFESANVPAAYNLEVNLRMSLISGANKVGGIYYYCAGGYEHVGTCKETNSNSTNNPIKIYIETDQPKWLRETSVYKPDLGTFSFENSYKFVSETTTNGFTYCLKRNSYSSYKAKNGGSISTGECACLVCTNGWGKVVNRRYRVIARFGSYAIDGICALRTVSEEYDVSDKYKVVGGSMQALISFKTESLYQGFPYTLPLHLS